MRVSAWSDVFKVWLYAAASIVLGAWISPLFYNAGKALAEVSVTKNISDVVDRVAKICRQAEFPLFYQVALMVAAVILFFPWMDWIKARRAEGETGGGAWRLWRPDGTGELGREVLAKNPKGIWQAAVGFLLAAGLLLPLGIAMMPGELSVLKISSKLFVLLVAKSLLIALLLELWFRGIALGVFLRAMSANAALGMSAVYFALVLSAFPAVGVDVVDAEVGHPGFELLDLLFRRFGEFSRLVGEFFPLVIFGAVLGHIRLRTASLWLPFGLHGGWVFSQQILDQVNGEKFHYAGLAQAAAIFAACALAQRLLAKPIPTDDESA